MLQYQSLSDRFPQTIISHLLLNLCCCLVAKLYTTLATPWTVVCQAPLSMGFSRQEYWSGLQFPSPGARSDPGIVPVSSAWQADSLPLNHQRSPSKSIQGLINLPFPSLQNLEKEVSTSFEILKVLVCLGGKCSYFLSHLAKGQLGISCSPCKPLGNKSQSVNLPPNTVINQLQLLFFFFFSKLQAERTMNSL